MGKISGDTRRKETFNFHLIFYYPIMGEKSLKFPWHFTSLHFHLLLNLLLFTLFSCLRDGAYVITVANDTSGKFQPLLNLNSYCVLLKFLFT